MKKTKIGLLPLYIALYDEASPHYRPVVEQFYETIASNLENKGLDVVRVPVCRLENEFASAVATFEREDADAIVTLHLAYSPSLESAKVLAGTALPVIVLDTTPDFEFNHGINSRAISYNHGIHGVMDMCNLLVRNGKRFQIFAGHYENSHVLDRVVDAANGAKMAKAIKSLKAVTFGEPFKGMGDFAIPYDKLKKDIGIDACIADVNELYPVDEARIRAEYEKDCLECDMQNVTYEDYKGPCGVALSIRDYIERNGIGAFSMNFLATGKDTPFNYIPFDEACKAMTRGIGYGGEGDVLTASYVAALMSVFPETSFAEIFCPDWAGDTLYISHMGEYNYNCTEVRREAAVSNFIYTDAGNPVVFYAPFKQGRAVFTCLAPMAEGYRMICHRGEMLHVPQGTSFNREVSGWFKPQIPVSQFLARYGALGGIHHAAVIYDGDTATLRSIARIMGWEYEEV